MGLGSGAKKLNPKQNESRYQIMDPSEERFAATVSPPLQH